MCFQLEFHDKAETDSGKVEFHVETSRAEKIDGRYLDTRHSNEAVLPVVVSRGKKKFEKKRARTFGVEQADIPKSCSFVIHPG